MTSDLTEFKESQSALKAALENSEKANLAKREFLSRMSHEIRTPMNAVIGMTRILEYSMDDPEKAQGCLRKINMASMHLLELINNCLLYTSFKYGEELCGDKVEIIRKGNFTTIVLADGLGSGVKANILSTLSSKIAATMISEGADIYETVETMASTLPVCAVRGLAYCTFTILRVHENGEAHLMEFDNPQVIILRDGKELPVDKTEIEIGDKKILERCV